VIVLVVLWLDGGFELSPRSVDVADGSPTGVALTLGAFVSGVLLFLVGPLQDLPRPVELVCFRFLAVSNFWSTSLVISLFFLSFGEYKGFYFISYVMVNP
jgi:hypothetical protein